ncbi:uncharacterized protein LOC111339744 [Stylophora pistillata]|uniref:uncharacterized protein LOC111339744 n=1 Tax=Stylophora pistillata TaxID=50429 RepID=UPI000C03F5C7|nr:uncharacterized protein LOC111339744 [Stylophora pistillata]
MKTVDHRFAYILTEDCFVVKSSSLLKQDRRCSPFSPFRFFVDPSKSADTVCFQSSWIILDYRTMMVSMRCPSYPKGYKCRKGQERRQYFLFWFLRPPKAGYQGSRSP